MRPTNAKRLNGPPGFGAPLGARRHPAGAAGCTLHQSGGGSAPGKVACACSWPGARYALRAASARLQRNGNCGKMKLPKQQGDREGQSRGRRGGSLLGRRRTNRTSDRHVTELLKVCLQKVCELQAEINSEGDHDAEAAGYSVCALETLRFLSSQGLPPDHPTITALRERLLRDRDE